MIFNLTKTTNIFNTVSIVGKTSLAEDNNGYEELIKEIYEDYAKLPQWEKDYLKKKIG